MRKSLIALVIVVSASVAVTQQATSPTPPATATTEKTAAPTQIPQPRTLLDGTPIKLRLSQTISSANAKVGQEIPFEVVEEVKVEDVVVLAKGATAIATVTEANAKKSMGRAGKLNLSINYARLIDQEKVALRAVQENKGGGHVGAMTGAIVATSIVFFPAAPLFLFMKGKDITIPQGTEITAFVEGDMHLDMARFGVVPPAAMQAPPTLQASIVVESAPTGADIELDGSFVGNTPSALNVAPGAHEISVKKKGFTDWKRNMNVAGGDVHVNAELEPGISSESAPASVPAGTPAVPAAPAK